MEDIFIRIPHHTFLYFSMGNGSARLLKVRSTAFRGGIWAPIWSTVPWVNASLPLTWHLDRFSRFAGLAVVPTNAEKYCEKLFSVRCNNNKCRRVSRLGLYWYSLNQGPDLQNILRRCYDYPTITTKLRSTYDGRLSQRWTYDNFFCKSYDQQLAVLQ